MAWVLVLFLLPLLPLVLFAAVVRRAIRIGRQLRDPEQLRSLLSDDVRAALQDAGLDPDSVSIQEIQKSEELSRLVAMDLRRVLRSSVLGLRVPESRDLSGAARRPLGHDAGPAMRGWSARASGRSEQPQLPPPIDQSSGPELRVLVVLAIVGLVAAAIFVSGLQP